MRSVECTQWRAVEVLGGNAGLAGTRAAERQAGLLGQGSVLL